MFIILVLVVAFICYLKLLFLKKKIFIVEMNNGVHRFDHKIKNKKFKH